jgi:hypothetical protein
MISGIIKKIICYCYENAVQFLKPDDTILFHFLSIFNKFSVDT